MMLNHNLNELPNHDDDDDEDDDDEDDDDDDPRKYLRPSVGFTTAK